MLGTQLHHGARVLFGAHQRALDAGLLEARDMQLFRALVGKIGRIRAQDLRLVVVCDAEGDCGRCDKDLVVVFIFKALPKHVQMQCAEEA